MDDLLRDTPDGPDLEIGPSSSSGSRNPPAPSQDTVQFFQEINDVGSSMDEIRTRLLKLQESSQDYRAVTRATALQVIKENMDKDFDQIHVIAEELRGRLEALDRSNAANRQIMNCQAGSSTDRSRMSMTSNLKKRLRELTVDFQELGLRFQDEFRDLVGRRLFTVTGQNIDESAIERLIETGDCEQIFENAILPQGRGEVLDIIAEIRERHDAVQDIERQLLELHQIFVDMGIVEEPPRVEILDNVEAEVRNAVEHVQVRNAVEHVQVGNAIQHVAADIAQRRVESASLAQAKMLMIVSAFICCLAIIILVVTVTQPRKKRPS